jgi:GNAT superfamily N-acetyltransferase
VMRVAFGTFLRLPDPASFAGDACMVAPRFAAEPRAAFVAERDGAIVGSCLAVRWGDVAFFGPLTVRPDLWDQGVAKRLLAPVLDRFTEWGVTRAGLFTFANSPRHLGLYQRFDFWPGPLTAVMWKRVRRAAAVRRDSASGGLTEAAAFDSTLMSSLDEAARAASIRDCRALAGDICDGLDVTSEVDALARLAARLDGPAGGDTVLVRARAPGGSAEPATAGKVGELTGFAVCHAGAGTEAGSGAAYVKFGGVRPGPRAAAHFDQLLAACEGFAASRGLLRLVAGVSTGRHQAYRAMLDRGFRSDVVGVTMHRGNRPSHHSAEVWTVDDWR